MENKSRGWPPPPTGPLRTSLPLLHFAAPRSAALATLADLSPEIHAEIEAIELLPENTLPQSEQRTCALGTCAAWYRAWIVAKGALGLTTYGAAFRAALHPRSPVPSCLIKEVACICDTRLPTPGGFQVAIVRPSPRTCDPWARLLSMLVSRRPMS